MSKVNKNLVQGAYELMQSPLNNKDAGKRGYMIYTTSQLINAGAKSKNGDWLNANVENTYFFISPEDRLRITQLCTPVLGVVTSRMHRIAGTKFVVTNDRIEQDEIAYNLKNFYQIWTEYKTAKEVEYIIARHKMYVEIKDKLTDVLPDLSNFDNALLRWKRSLQRLNQSKCDEVMDWLQEPNINDNFEDFVRKYVFDLMVHGSVAIYKDVQNGQVENIHILPGGTVIPIRDKFVSAKQAFVQLINAEEPQIFFSDELSYSTYIPVSARSYGIVPLEALMNKIAESLMFDKLSANGADSTRLPEKMIIINDSSPFGGAEGDAKEFVPIAESEQKKLEKKMNTPIQGGIMSFSGNSATIVDLSRENVMEFYNSRQKDIREDVALVFNMSNMEVNLTGSGDTSGRSTAESQQEIDQGKGVVPVLRTIEKAFTKDILPFRFGTGYTLKAEITKSPMEEIDYLTKKVNSGLYSVNEIKVNDLNENPFDDAQYNTPKGAVEPQPGSEGNPMFTKQQ